MISYIFTFATEPFLHCVINLKEQDTRKLEIPFDELKHLSNYYSRSQARFIKDLEHVYDKMLHLTYTERNEKQSFEKFVLFTSYKVDIKNNTCLLVLIIMI